MGNYRDTLYINQDGTYSNNYSYVYYMSYPGSIIYGSESGTYIIGHGIYSPPSTDYDSIVFYHENVVFHVDYYQVGNATLYLNSNYPASNGASYARQ